MSDSRWWYSLVMRKQFTIFYTFLVYRAACPLCTAIAAGVWGPFKALRSQRVLDALRCILSLIWALNRLFQMEILPVLRKSFTFSTLSWCAGLFACGTPPLQPRVWGPQKPEGSRCSEMHSQPYLSPKWIIPDENSSRFEKISYLFYPVLVCKAVCLWHTTIAAGGIGAALKAPRSKRVLDARSEP